MFDPVTIDLITRAPPLGDLDFEALPQRFTNAFAEIVPCRRRGFRGCELPPAAPQPVPLPGSALL